jgi:hypothetical protein
VQKPVKSVFRTDRVANTAFSIQLVVPVSPYCREVKLNRFNLRGALQSVRRCSAASTFINPVARPRRLSNFSLPPCESSSKAQLLAYFPTPPCDKSTSTHYVRCVSFISYGASPVRTQLTGLFRFLVISHHRIAALFVIPLSHAEVFQSVRR